MSGNYWGRNNPFEPENDEANYRAWTSCQQGHCAAFELIPTNASGEPDRAIPYLQPITTEHYAESGQLCLMCHGTGMMIFFEGRGLDELDNQLAERRVKSIHVFDPAVHAPPENDAMVVTKITVENS